MTQERLSYAYGTSSQPLLGMTIGEKFDQACQQMRNKMLLSACIKMSDSRIRNYKLRSMHLPAVY